MILVKVNPQQYEELAAKVQAQGLQITGKSGTVTAKGVVASYSYDGTANLSVNVLKAPLPLTRSLCEGKIRSIFAEQGCEVV